MKLFYGLEADGDGIHSTNLGAMHATGRQDTLMPRCSEPLHCDCGGVRQEILSGGYHVTSPMLAAATT